MRFSTALLSVFMLASNAMFFHMPCEAAEDSPEQVTELPAFTVIGPFVRTTNAVEIAGQGGKIGPLWKQFLQGGGESIQGVVEKETIYAVYTNYDSDETGAYDLILGKAVLPSQQIPINMKMLRIPAARYIVFPVKDSSPAAITKAWMNVYAYFTHHSGFRRAFTDDFEQHANTATQIFIAIK